MTISPKWITIGRRAAEWLTGCRCRRGCSPGSLTHSRSQAAHLCIARRTGLTDDAVWRSSIGAACRPIQATPHPDSPVACKSSPQRLDSGRAPATGRIGRRTNSPLQFGHLPCSTVATHCAQNVHSKEQIIASRDSGGRSLLQHSQLRRSCSMGNSSS